MMLEADWTAGRPIGEGRMEPFPVFQQISSPSWPPPAATLCVLQSLQVMRHKHPKRFDSFCGPVQLFFSLPTPEVLTSKSDLSEEKEKNTNKRKKNRQNPTGNRNSSFQSFTFRNFWSLGIPEGGVFKEEEAGPQEESLE